MRNCLTILWILSFAGLTAELLSQKPISAVPASPYPIAVLQSDGTSIQVLGKGDENVNYATTLDGFPIVKNQTGIYEYAIADGEDHILPSRIKASDPGQRSIRELEFLYQLDAAAVQRSLMEDAKDLLEASGSESATIDKEAFPTTGNRKVLLLLIEYPDLGSTYSNTDFDNLMNQTNYNGTGSFRDYFDGMSRGQLILSTDVFGWYVAANNYLYYGEDNGDNVARELVAEAVDAAEAAGVDFSQYDNDGDGYVDGITVVHSGPGAEEGAQTEYIWSHRWSLGTFYSRSYDGVIINSYNICPETRSWGMTGVGVFCHEFGHILGLPDLYDTDGGSEGIGRWGLMGSGSWLNLEKSPSGMTAWSRIGLGWISPIEIDQGSFTIEPSVNVATVYQILTDAPNEYFLLENRQQTGQDEYLPGEGLAIWHIDDTRSSNTDESHKMVDLEEADGDDDLDHEVNRGDAGDLYPGTTNATEFNSATYPNSNLYSSEASGINIYNIAENNLTLSFTLEGESEYNPCEHISTIPGCNSTQSFEGGGSGAWDNSLCGLSTPGSEQVFGFTAPETGIYNIEVVSASGYMSYGWRSSSCDENGWTCIGNLNTPGTYGSMSWTAGTSYYILLDDTDETSGEHQFFINCPDTPDPVLVYDSHSIDDDNTTSSGNNNGYADAGETIEMPVILSNTGSGDAHNVSAVLSSANPFITITDNFEVYNNINAGANASPNDDFDFVVDINCPEGNVTFSLNMTSDEGSWTDQFEVYVYATSLPNPCDNVIPITGCDLTQSFAGGGNGSWDNGMCGYSSPGSEQVYSFVAPETGIYSIEVVSASGNMVYGWRSSSCDEDGWSCIGDINAPGTYGSISWIAGTSYYILLDDENTSTGTHSFHINCPQPPGCEDIYEPNESYTSASTGVFNSLGADLYSASLNGTIHDAGDEDYYRINTTEQGFIFISLPDPPADFDLELLGPGGSLLEYSTTSGSEYIQYQIQNPGYHYFHVYGSGGANSCTEYTLQMQWHPSVSLHLETLLIDDDNQGESAGNGNGLIEPGETIELEVWIQNDGPGHAYDAGLILENTYGDPDLQLQNEDIFIGYIPTGESRSGTQFNTFVVDPDCLEKDLSFTLRPYTPDQDFHENITLHVYPALQDPCSNIVEIEGCGQAYTQHYSSESRTGFWDLNLCGYEALGTEQIYRFEAPVTGTYSIELTGTGDHVLYAWNSSCSVNGWNCIGDLSSQQGTYGSMNWIAGSTYYILLKDLDNASDNHQFHINCPAAVPNLTSYTPEGWEDGIVVSSISGTNQSTEIIQGNISYIDFALTNTGDADAGYHRSCIYLNSNIIRTIEFYKIPQGQEYMINDWEYTFTETGVQTIKLVLDVENDVTESDKTDNVYEKQILVSSSTSVNAPGQQDNIILYPNPSSGICFLEIHHAFKEKQLIEIADPAGRVIWNKQMDSQAPIARTRMDLSGNPAGLYFVRVINGESISVHKLILVK